MQLQVAENGDVWVAADDSELVAAHRRRDAETGKWGEPLGLPVPERLPPLGFWRTRSQLRVAPDGRATALVLSDHHDAELLHNAYTVEFDPATETWGPEYTITEKLTAAKDWRLEVGAEGHALLYENWHGALPSTIDTFHLIERAPGATDWGEPVAYGSPLMPEDPSIGHRIGLRAVHIGQGASLDLVVEDDPATIPSGVYVARRTGFGDTDLEWERPIEAGGVFHGYATSQSGWRALAIRAAARDHHTLMSTYDPVTREWDAPVRLGHVGLPVSSDTVSLEVDDEGNVWVLLDSLVFARIGHDCRCTLERFEGVAGSLSAGGGLAVATWDDHGAWLRVLPHGPSTGDQPLSLGRPTLGVHHTASATSTDGPIWVGWWTASNNVWVREVPL